MLLAIYVHSFIYDCLYNSRMTVVINIPVLSWRKLKHKDDFKMRFCCMFENPLCNLNSFQDQNGIFFFSITSTVLVVIWIFLADQLPSITLLPLVWSPVLHLNLWEASHGFQEKVAIPLVLRPFPPCFSHAHPASFPALPSLYLYLHHYKLVKNSSDWSLRFTLCLSSLLLWPCLALQRLA